jgi:hypothetical protein
MQRADVLLDMPVELLLGHGPRPAHARALPIAGLLQGDGRRQAPRTDSIDGESLAVTHPDTGPCCVKWPAYPLSGVP